jgi:hypothetical protein
MNKPFCGVKKRLFRWHNDTWRGRILDAFGVCLAEVKGCKNRKEATEKLDALLPAVRAQLQKAKI